jgi:hypothetical protein
MFLEHVLPMIPVLVNHLYYKSEELSFTTERALEFFILLSDSILAFSVHSADQTRCNFEMISEHGIMNALVNLSQTTD